MENQQFDFMDTMKESIQTVNAKINQAPLRKILTKRGALYGGIAVAVLIVLIVLISSLNNNYKTPIRKWEDAYNDEDATIDEILVDGCNGFAEDEVDTLMELLRDNGMAEEALDRGYYIEDYEISMKIEDKEELKESELKAYEKSLKTLGALCDTAVDSYAWDKLVDKWDWDKSDAKAWNKAMKSLGKTLQEAEVTKGYALEIDVMTTSSDDEDESSRNEDVILVDGCWIRPSTLSGIGTILKSLY